MQSSHIMILNSTKYGGNRTKHVEVGPDRRTDGETDRPIPIPPPPKKKTMFAGGIIILFTKHINNLIYDLHYEVGYKNIFP